MGQPAVDVATIVVGDVRHVAVSQNVAVIMVKMIIIANQTIEMFNVCEIKIYIYRDNVLFHIYIVVFKKNFR